MNNQITKSKLRGVQLKGDAIHVLDNEIYYKLYVIRRGGARLYAINVTAGKESSTCCFGKDRQSAMDIYSTIVENSVTPCTLCDIAEDFSKRAKKSRR